MPNAVVALGFVVDRDEVLPDGSVRPALLESGFTSMQVEAELANSLDGFDVIEHSTRHAEVVEERAGETYTLCSTLVTWLGIAPPR